VQVFAAAEMASRDNMIKQDHLFIYFHSLQKRHHCLLYYVVVDNNKRIIIVCYCFLFQEHQKFPLSALKLASFSNNNKRNVPERFCPLILHMEMGNILNLFRLEMSRQFLPNRGEGDQGFLPS